MTARLLDSVAINAGISVAAFGLSPLLKKVAIEDGVVPWTVALVSACGAALVGVAVLARLSPERLVQLFERRNLLPLAGIGIAATGIVTVLAAAALSTTTATNRSLFQAAYPAATLFFAHLLLGERLRLQQYAAILLLLAGLVVMNDSSLGFRFGQGFWLLLATLPLVGLTDVYSKRLTEETPPLVLAAGRSLYGALFIVAVVPFVDLGGGLTAGQSVVLLAAGGFQGIGIWTLFRAFERSKASLVSSLVATSPLVTLVLEATFLQLSMTSLQWFGMLTVVGGAVWLAQTGQRGKD